VTTASVIGAVIRPGQTFTDDNGRTAQLHGVGIQKFGDRYYAWGEDKSTGSTFTAVACYSSLDLASWRFESNALEQGSGELGADRIIERPKVLAHPDGGYVMFLHIESANYSDARVGYAVSESPVGPFRYVGSERPLGNQSRDIGVYQEGGLGYLLSEDRANGLHIYRLADDYLSAETIVSTTVKDDGSHGYESPVLIKHDGLYYLFGSDLTGWSSNDNKVATARDLSGPWSSWSDIAPTGSTTFDSQISTIVPVETTQGTAYVYIGDRWDQHDLAHSAAVWLPLFVDDGRASIRWRGEWRLSELRP
jgi:hypothetical protein